jgi:hypothetical protein
MTEQFWLIALIIIVICLLKWIVNQIFFEPAGRRYEGLVKDCLSKLAIKHSGTMTGTVATIPYKTVGLEVSFVEGVDEVSVSHVYATFGMEVFPDKKLGIYYWKEFSLRPAVVTGSRLELFEDELGDAYRVSGNDISFVEAVVTPMIRGRLLEFEEENLRVEFGRPHGSFTLSRERGWLTVSAFNKSGVVEEDYDKVIAMAILFYESLAALSPHRRAARPDLSQTAS